MSHSWRAEITRLTEFDLVVSGGTVATADDVVEATVAIKDGVIAGLLAPETDAVARERIDASGLVVVPGGVDPHVHFWGRHAAFNNKHDFDNGTIAAAIGGTTCFINFAVQRGGQTPLAAVEE